MQKTKSLDLQILPLPCKQTSLVSSQATITNLLVTYVVYDSPSRHSRLRGMFQRPHGGAHTLNLSTPPCRVTLLQQVFRHRLDSPGWVFLVCLRWDGSWRVCQVFPVQKVGLPVSGSGSGMDRSPRGVGMWFASHPHSTHCHSRLWAILALPRTGSLAKTPRVVRVCVMLRSWALLYLIPYIPLPIHTIGSTVYRSC